MSTSKSYSANSQPCVPGWKDAISPYVKNNKIFVCLSVAGRGNPYYPTTNLDNKVQSYMANGYLGWMWVVKLAEISEPSNLAMVGDAFINCNSANYYLDINGNQDSDRTRGRYDWADDFFGWRYMPPSPHGGGCNVAFADGHSKHVKDKQIILVIPWAVRPF